MTTIAYHYDSKTIAYDGRVTSDFNIDTDEEEKCIERNGEYWFYAGVWHDREWFIGNFSEGEKCDRKVEGCAFVVIGHDVYDCYVHDGLFKRTLIRWNDALGTGRPWALASMDHGKSASEAVAYAKTRDAATGGRVKIHKVGGARVQLAKTK